MRETTRRAHPLAVVNIEAITIELRTDAPGYGSVMYEIDLESCRTPGAVLFWIFQIWAKSWATPGVMESLISALDDAFKIFHGRGVQALVRRKGELSWPRAEHSRFKKHDDQYIYTDGHGHEVARFNTEKDALDHARSRGYGKAVDEGFIRPDRVARVADKPTTTGETQAGRP